jgi:hypothetical protein
MSHCINQTISLALCYVSLSILSIMQNAAPKFNRQLLHSTEMQHVNKICKNKVSSPRKSECVSFLSFITNIWTQWWPLKGQNMLQQAIYLHLAVWLFSHVISTHPSSHSSHTSDIFRFSWKRQQCRLMIFTWATSQPCLYRVFRNDLLHYKYL